MKTNKKGNIFLKTNHASHKHMPMIPAILTGVLISTIIVLLVNYLLPTPWNIHSAACWIKILAAIIIYASINGIMLAFVTGNDERTTEKKEEICGASILIILGVIVVMIIGALSGAQIFHSSTYADLIQVQEVESSDTILSEKDAESIALMDTASATQLGDREIGAIKNFSAFNVSDNYIQLNVKNDAVKIAPLEYAGLFKWIKNKDSGVTGYVTVSPTTMTADYVELPQGMQYVPSAYFGKDLNRHLHKQFPTLMYGNIHFEIDEDGNPYYVSSVYEHTIGLLGGEIVTGAILTDPVSGESQYYDLDETPGWVDDVVDGDLICSLYNVAYKNKNGYWNGTFLGANTGCMQTTTLESSDDDDDDDSDSSSTDYGYIAKDGDIYIYTGVTSMAKDSSNLGFIMVNERTGEYRYFAVSGANEQSAMKAAEGEVQQYSYEASFPTLINIDNELTYIGVLKDSNGLVKMYYMVNVKDYGKVVVASHKADCMSDYIEELGLHPDQALIDQTSDQEESGEDIEENTEKEDKIAVTFEISAMQYVDVDGDTYVYLGTSDGTVYKSRFADNEQLLFVSVGDKVSGTVSDGTFIFEQKNAED